MSYLRAERLCIDVVLGMNKDVSLGIIRSFQADQKHRIPIQRA